MALPTSRPRTYSAGDPVEPDDLNDIFDQIIRLMGDGILDVPLLAGGRINANAGLYLPDGQYIELGDAPNQSLRFSELEPVMLPYSACQWSPSNDTELLLHATDGYIVTSAPAVAVRLHIPLLGFPYRGFLQNVYVSIRRNTGGTWTASLRKRTIGGVVTVIDTAVSSVATNDDDVLLMGGLDEEYADFDTTYFLTLTSTAVSNLRYYHTLFEWNRPLP